MMWQTIWFSRTQISMSKWKTPKRIARKRFFWTESILYIPGSRQGCQHLPMLQDMEILQIPHLWLTLHTCVATDCIRCQCCVRWFVWWGLWLGFPRVSLWSIRRAIVLVLLLLREFLVVVFLMERRRSFHRNSRSGLCVHGNNNFWMLVFLRPHV
jgi:hypothetical protein